MTIDLNRLPYFDDYDENKNYHRILFKPGLAVQARELTQMQTILQNQIERFGDHVFKNGSRVLGGTFDPQDPVDYVRVQTNFNDLAGIVGAELTGTVTGLKARVIHAEADPNEVGVSVLFINYTDSNNTENVTSFTSETINYTTATTSGTFTPTLVNITGKGSVFGITEGVLYVNGYFVRFDSQKIAIDPFNSSANKRVYFRANFSIIDSNTDTSLLDNAQGYNNFNAPGADRLKCELTLNVSDLTVDLSDDSNFLLLELRNGEAFERNERTLYNEVAEELARRTFNESGDYVVRGWDVRTREHLDTGSNGGRYSVSEGGDSDKIVIELEKGLAYVKGYEVETVSTRPLETDKSTDFNFVDNQFSFVPSGPHIIVDQIMGLPNPDNYSEIDLYDTAETRISSEIAYNTSPSGTKIGTARLISYIEEDGQFGQSDATARFYVADVIMNEGKSFANVKAIANSDFFADVKLDNGIAVIYDINNNSRLIYVGNDYTRSVKNEAGNSEFSLTFAKQGTGTIGTNGQLTGVVSLGTNETLIYGTATLGSLAKETLFLNVTESAVIIGDGTATTTNGSAIVAGSSANFNKLNEGDRIRLDGSLYQIESIEGNDSLTLTENATSTSTATWTKEYIAGDIIDLNSKGYTSGTVRTVTTTPTSISINLGETLASTTDCKLAYRIVKNPVTERAKTIRAQRYVKVDGSSAADLDKFYLGVPDVFEIREVRKHTSAITLPTDGVDVTSQFTLVPNISGFSYNTSYVTTNTPITTSEHLLIVFDYFEPDLAGSGNYFSVDSYPINDAVESDTTIQTSDLDAIQRNYIDFRAVKSNTVTTGTSIATAPTNPAESTSFVIPAGGYRSPVPGTNLTFDYSYYLARKDVLAVKSNGEFKVFKGKSGLYPSFPRVSETYMPIANIHIPPYPSLSTNFAKILGTPELGVASEKITHSRHTMADIGAIKQRVKNLEYYNALSLLEKNTLELTITDENGLDRFKNGVFVNPFADHTLSDVSNPDYNIGINRKEKNIQPAYNVEGFDTNYASGSNVTKTGSLVHLPFTETVLKEQMFATTTRNIELSSYRYVGDLNLYPDVDTWVDTTTVDKTFEIGNDIEEGKIISTEVGSWQTVATGAVSGAAVNTYKVYHRNGGDMQFSGNEKLLKTFNTMSEVMQYVGASRYIGQYGDDDFNNRSLQSALDRASRARYFIVSGNSVTTEETVLQERTNIETVVSSETETNELGSFVTDASLVPYIRPQTIKLYAFGLKPNTRFHVFFDGENMNAYSTPVSVTSYFDSEAQTNTGYLDYDTDLSGIGAEGDNLFSNSRGEVLVFLRLPAGTSKRFRVGEKEVVITDSPTNDPDASSYSRNTFVASGLNLQKQNTILSTKTRTVERREITETRQQTIQRSSTVPQGWFEVGPSCAAYSVYVDEDDSVDGVFLSSVDIWLSALHPTLGVWFEIREMSSDGGITRNTVPYSTVWMNRNDSRLKISTDGIANATNVNFDSPVFLYNKTQYAFVIHTEGLNPDTYFWVSRLGGIDVGTGNVVSNRAQFGTFYTTNNNLNWGIVPDLDLKIRFNRINTGASASTKTGTATFVVEDVEFISANTSLPATFFNDGEPVRGTEILNIALDGGAVLQIGDKITDGTSNTSSFIVDVDGTDIYTNGFDYIANSAVTIYQGDTATVRNTGTVSTVNFGTGIIDKIDSANNRFDIMNSNGRFFVGCKLRSILPQRHKSVLNGTGLSVTYSGAGSTVPNPYAPTGVIKLPVGLDPSSTTSVPEFTIDQFTTFEFTSATIRPSYLNFGDESNVTFATKVTTGTTIGSSVPVNPNEEIEYNTVKNILSRSEEVRLLSGQKSFQIVATLNSTTDFLSPILDSSLMGVVLTENQLNSDITGETNATGGNLLSKYISRVVRLTDVNAAEDLNVLLQEYRPDSTDVKVWARLRSNADIRDITDIGWFELSSSKTAVSSSVNKENYIDTTYTIPAEMLTGDQGAVQYTESGNLAVFSGSEMVANTEYVIVSSGTTDFTDYGAANNDTGTAFTATGPSDGTGTVSLASDLIYTRYNEFQLKIGLYGSNAAVYPKASSLRAIALQK